MTLIAFADADTLRAAAEALGLPLRLLPPDEIRRRNPANLPWSPSPMPCHPAFGAPDPRNAACRDRRPAATRPQACLDGRFDGLVTGPVHKAAINDGGIAYTGTTELLAGRPGARW